MAYVVVTVKARLEGMDRHIEEAAMDLGAGEWTTFRKVTLPLIAPGVAAAAMLSAAISFDDYVITSFNAGQTQTFPLFIFGATRQGVPPEVNVLATALLGIVLLLMVFNVIVQRRLARRDAARAVDAEAHEQRLAA
jgi:spermidine/putrescine transport system permease protein